MSSEERHGWAEALREAGLGETEARETEQVLGRLAAWRAPAPTGADTAALVSRLQAVVAAPPPRKAPIQSELTIMLAAARAQLMVLPLTLWLGSAVVMVIGVALVGLGLDPSRSLVLYLVGPTLAYLGVRSGFRGSALGTTEVELSCPATPRQLVIARLVVVLGYQVAAGIVLSLPIWLWNQTAVFAVTADWLAPLLLAFGAALVLSLRFSVSAAAAVVYTAWMLVVLLRLRLGGPGVSFGVDLDAALGAAGLLMLGAGTVFLAHGAPGDAALGRSSRTYGSSSA